MSDLEVHIGTLKEINIDEARRQNLGTLSGVLVKARSQFI